MDELTRHLGLAVPEAARTLMPLEMKTVRQQVLQTRG
jgi:hypothetical protein